MRLAEGFVPRAAVFVSPGGEVLPPDHIVRRLQAISPRLGLRWMTGAHIPYWALTEEWPTGDPRWAKVQSGEIPRHMAFGIAHIFRLDVTTEDMAAYVEQRWSETAHREEGGAAVKEADARVTETRVSTAAVKDRHIQRATQESLERHERESRHALRVRAGTERAHPMITVPK